MLWLKVPVVDTINSKGNKFATSVKIKATGESKLNANTESQSAKSRNLANYFPH